ncbi:hypothetical protein DFH06DRAFT_400508 [Mycena polygramma]|nr:hypothetical protein DFH06DRAFT_400508 [Mycena polygramma]
MPTGLMCTNPDCDEVLYQGHLRKTESGLIQIRSRLRQLDEKLQHLRCDVNKHEARIGRMEARAREVVRNAESTQVPKARLQELRRDSWHELGVARVPLYHALAAREDTELARDSLLRDEAALLMPFTLDAFRVAPIRHLPAEVLLEIFMAARTKDVETVGRGSLPLLSQVCGEWRNVACAHPALWASISFALFDVTASTLAWVQVYLERSKAAPLSLEMHASKSFRRSTLNPWTLDLLDGHLERLYSFSLTGSHCSQVDLLGWHSRLPRLENLRLPHLAAALYKPFEVLPRLSTLSLQSAAPPRGVPISQVTSLCIVGDLNPVDLLGFSNLTSLAFTYDVRPQSAHWTHVTLPGLTCWKVDFGHGPQTPPDFFDFFTTPALISLEVTALLVPVPIAAFLSRSQCPLTSLTLRRCYSLTTDLRQMFEHSRDLESLVVVFDVDVTADIDKVLELLTIHNETAVLLPKLRRLYLEGQYSVDDAVLVEMVESRVAGPTGTSNRLESAEIVVRRRAMAEECAQRLNALKGVSLICPNR